MKYITLLIFIFTTKTIFSQDCSSLRGEKEKSYATTVEGKTLSFCDVPEPTPYTKCLCEKERNSKKAKDAKKITFDTAEEKVNLAKEAYLAGNDLILEAKYNKDPNKLKATKKLFDQAIKYAKEANAIYDSYYNNLPKNMADIRSIYKEYPNGIIDWSRNLSASLPSVEKEITAVEKTMTINFKSTNNWDSPEIAKGEPKEENSNDYISGDIDNWTQEETLKFIVKRIKTMIEDDYPITLLNNEIIMKSNVSPTGFSFGSEDPTTYKINVNCFEHLARITDISSNGRNQQFPGYYIEFHLWDQENCIKHRLELDKDGFSYEDSFYIGFDRTKINLIKNIELAKLLNAFVHLAVLNGADKSKITVTKD